MSFVLITLLITTTLSIDLPERPPGRFDILPPQVLSLAITPTLIDVRETGQMLETSVRVIDDFAGVAKVELEVSGRMGSDQSSLMRAASFQTGSRHDGYWKLKKNIPPLSANGTWRVSSLAVTDLQGNRKTYTTSEIGQITQAFVEVFSGLCFTSPWLCVDTASDPSAVAWLDGFWSLDSNTPKYGAGIQLNQTEIHFGVATRTVKTLQELVQQDNEQDKKRNWLYEFYRRRWNATTASFPLKE
jgi:hypothetical protein